MECKKERRILKILIMGLPGSGKTTLAEELKRILIEDGKSVLWLNADAIQIGRAHV